ncbi:DUF6582 domain-containing protein [Deinococcus aluminii]|uniref:Uncharacterized protein n=1 Tax=Deinococcus aluminii TaxID=1656885 RepID=A0ABP9XGH2_9DEIO
MSELSDKQREQLKDQQFAYIDRQGGRHLPIEDETHVRNAVARFSQTDFESGEAKHQAAQKIVQAAHKYGIELSDDDAVVKAARSKG